MRVLALDRSLGLLTEIHLYGFGRAEEFLEGLNEDQLNDVADVLMDGVQSVLAARRVLRDKS